MTTTPSAPTLFQYPEYQPRQHFAEFERQVFDDAGSSCLEISPHGLLSSANCWDAVNNDGIVRKAVPDGSRDHKR